MTQKIFEALKAKFQGVNDNILFRIATNKGAKSNPQNEEEVKKLVEEITIQNVMDSYADYRATESSKTAEANYLKKLEDYKKEAEARAAKPKPEKEEGQPEQPKAAEIPEWAKTLMESNKALGEQLKAMQQTRVAESRRGQLSKITASLPNVMRKAYDRTPVEGQSEEEFQSLLAEISGEVAELSKEQQAKGAVFGKPTAFGGVTDKQASDKEVADVVERLSL